MQPSLVNSCSSADEEQDEGQGRGIFHKRASKLREHCFDVKSNETTPYPVVIQPNIAYFNDTDPNLCDYKDSSCFKNSNEYLLCGKLPRKLTVLTRTRFLSAAILIWYFAMHCGKTNNATAEQQTEFSRWRTSRYVLQILSRVCMEDWGESYVKVKMA